MRPWLYVLLALAALQFTGLSPFGAAYSLFGRTVGLVLPRSEHDIADDSIVTAMKNVTTDFNQVSTRPEARRFLGKEDVVVGQSTSSECASTYSNCLRRFERETCCPEKALPALVV